MPDEAMGSFQQQLFDRVTAPIKKAMEGSSRKELLNAINTTLMVFDDELVHVESGDVASLESKNADAIAAAAKQLIVTAADEIAVLLLLPSPEFISSAHAFPGLSKENLISALRLQTETILPSYEKSLSLAIDANSGDGGMESIALWMPQSKLNALFQAFNAENLFLAAIKPRILNVTIDNLNECVLDEDSTDVSFVTFKDGFLRSWQQVNKQDFEQQDFSKQWERSVKKDSNGLVKEYSNFQHYLAPLNKSRNNEYNFFPTDALNARKKIENSRKVLAGVIVLAVLLFVSVIPFLQQSLEFRSAAATLESNRLMSTDARQDQQMVVNFENEWGALSDFPDQRIREAMFTLQNVLSPERLTSLEISEGLVKIQGTSSDPQAILQRLEQDPLFTEVIFSRATNNTRYYIDLRLSPVNFEAYMVRHFPDD